MLPEGAATLVRGGDLNFSGSRKTVLSDAKEQPCSLFD